MMRESELSAQKDSRIKREPTGLTVGIVKKDNLKMGSKGKQNLSKVHPLKQNNSEGNRISMHSSERSSKSKPKIEHGLKMIQKKTSELLGFNRRCSSSSEDHLDIINNQDEKKLRQ